MRIPSFVAVLLVALGACTATPAALSEREALYAAEVAFTEAVDEIALMRELDTFTAAENADIDAVVATVSEALDAAHLALSTREPITAYLAVARAGVRRLLIMKGSAGT